MRGDVTATLLEYRDDSADATMQRVELYRLKGGHSDVRLITSNNAFEHVLLNNKLAEIPKIFVPFFNEGIFDLRVSFLGRLNDGGACQQK